LNDLPYFAIAQVADIEGKLFVNEIIILIFANQAGQYIFSLPTFNFRQVGVRTIKFRALPGHKLDFQQERESQKWAGFFPGKSGRGED
jgi:hypothetical protein